MTKDDRYYAERWRSQKEKRKQGFEPWTSTIQDVLNRKVTRYDCVTSA